MTIKERIENAQKRKLAYTIIDLPTLIAIKSQLTKYRKIAKALDEYIEYDDCPHNENAYRQRDIAHELLKLPPL